MKVSIFSIFATLTLSSGLILADEFYTATLTGVDCDDCKRTIAKSLAKIEGVKVIRIEKNGDGTHRLTVTTEDGTEITGQQASDALKHADHYKIQSWSKTENPPQARN